MEMKKIAVSRKNCFTPCEEALFSIVSAKEHSYREILLCIIAHMQIFPDMKASIAWYSFHPRGLYDSGPVKKFLQEQNIPHTKSGPLNISKAANIDKVWADNRSSPEIANLVLNVVSYLENNNSFKSVQDVGVSLIKKMLADAVRIENLTLHIKPSCDPDYLTDICIQLIRNAPDAGNTPHKIVAFLLKNYHTSVQSAVNITGINDRASVTSTTSKKPGDINEERYGQILKVYEITVKPFDFDRILDSYDCLCTFNQKTESPIHEVIVICRPEDCPSQMEISGFATYFGKIIYRDVVYYFWNIYEWISSMLQQMPSDGKELFSLELSGYVSEVNTSESVKLEWRRIHSLN